MTEDRRGQDRRSGDRRASGRRQSDAIPSVRALVPTGPLPPGQETPGVPASGPAPASAKPQADAAFAAQVLADDGNRRRGLKGGPEVLDKARSTYLNAEYSGPADRRPAKGKALKSEI